jgi:hypothetical protein
MLLWKKISKDDLVLKCGVARSNKISYYLLSNEISNFLDEIPLAVLNRVVFHQDGAIPRNARMNFVFLNHLNHFGERWMGADGSLHPQIWIHWISLFSFETFETIFIWPHPKRVKKIDSASMSGKTPKFFTECKGGYF